LPNVGVMDMLAVFTQNLRSGWALLGHRIKIREAANAPGWGPFASLYAYSRLHHIRPKRLVVDPATFITEADAIHDDCAVVPGHSSFKFRPRTSRQAPRLRQSRL